MKTLTLTKDEIQWLVALVAQRVEIEPDDPAEARAVINKTKILVELAHRVATAKTDLAERDR